MPEPKFDQTAGQEISEVQQEMINDLREIAGNVEAENVEKYVNAANRAYELKTEKRKTEIPEEYRSLDDYIPVVISFPYERRLKSAIEWYISRLEQDVKKGQRDSGMVERTAKSLREKQGELISRLHGKIGDLERKVPETFSSSSVRVIDVKADLEKEGLLSKGMEYLPTKSFYFPPNEIKQIWESINVAVWKDFKEFIKDIEKEFPDLQNPKSVG